MKRIVAICDYDHSYLYKVYEYFEKYGLSDFEIKIFDRIEDAGEYGKEQPFELFLVHEKYLQEIKEFSYTTCLVALCETYEIDTKAYTCVSKYQSMEKLRQQLLKIYAENDHSSLPIQHVKPDKKVYTFLSLHNQENMSACALAAGQLLKEHNEKVLYINLQPFSGIFYLLENESKYDLSDLIYYAIKYEEKTMLKIECMKQKINGIDCLPGIKDYEDLLKLSKEQWKQFLIILLEHTEYDCLIFDCNGATFGCMDVLQRSHQIFLPEAQKPFEKEMERKMLKFIQKREIHNFWQEKTEYISPLLSRQDMVNIMMQKLHLTEDIL